MPTELEAKIQVDDFEPIRARLKELGTKQTERRFERNVYFDSADKRLQKVDQGVRIRSIRPIDGVEERHVITFKGKQGDGGDLKSREEIEFTVGDDAAATQFLAKLGLHPTLGFEKRREVWELPECDCEIVLDELPLLGRFVEVEGPDASAIHEVLSKLGLEKNPLITRGYISMLDEKRRESGSGETMFTL